VFITLAKISFEKSLMYRDSERFKVFSRRSLILTGGKVAFLSVLVGRMYYLQVIEADKYRMLSDENRINLRLLSPRRGMIVDRYDQSLADNQQNYRVLLISENTQDIDYTLNMLSQIITISPLERRRIKREVKRNRNFIPVTVRTNLNWEDVARIELNAPDLPGILIDVGESRYYQFGSEVAHILGYVAAVSAEELGTDPLLHLSGFRIGKAGIEKVHDLALRGSGGSSQVEVNAFGRVIRELSRQEGQPGAKVKLTVDLHLQKMIFKRLKGESGAVVVLDVRSGDVLGMVSTPGYDPNSFNRGMKVDEWKILSSDQLAPLTNKVIAGRYAPGSTFKMVVLLAALERGIISSSTQFFCNGAVELGNAKFHCWNKYGHGLVDSNSAISRSCDVFFYEIAKRTGVDKIAAMAFRLGLGSKSGIDLPGEQAGVIPTKRWKRDELKLPWHQGETLLTGIGQGYVLVTPLQLAVMTARLVNGGIAIEPRLTLSIDDVEEKESSLRQREFNEIGIPMAHLNLVRDAMIDVVNTPSGTAFRSRIKPQKIAMGGKTGTVQVRRISKSERQTGVIKNKSLPWKERDHALFVGFAPTIEPRYAVSVVIEHGGSGSSKAAPIARDILLETQRRGLK